MLHMVLYRIPWCFSFKIDILWIFIMQFCCFNFSSRYLCCMSPNYIVDYLVVDVFAFAYWPKPYNLNSIDVKTIKRSSLVCRILHLKFILINILK